MEVQPFPSQDTQKDTFDKVTTHREFGKSDKDPKMDHDYREYYRDRPRGEFLTRGAALASQQASQPGLDYTAGKQNLFFSNYRMECDYQMTKCEEQT